MAVRKFDDIFEIIGEFQTFQILSFIILSAISYMGLEVIWGNFTAYQPDHWCKIPELSDLPYDVQKYIAIPKEWEPRILEERYSMCWYYDLNYTNVDYRIWNRSEIINNGTEQKRCDSWVYDRSIFTRTIVTEFDLVCKNAFYIDAIASVTLLGAFIGALPVGLIGDRIGRRKTLLLTLILKILGNVLSTGIPNFIVFMIGRFIVGMATIGAYQICIVLLTEIIGPKYRNVTGIGFPILYSLGFMSLPIVAFFVRDYIRFQIVWTLPCVVLMSSYILIPESPRWLLLKGRLEECHDVLKYIAAVNERELPDTLELKEVEVVVEDNGDRSGSVADLFRTPRMRMRTLVLSFGWFTCNLIFFALSLNAGNLVGNLFLNAFLLGVVEIPSNFLTMWAINNKLLGRRYTHVIGFIIAGFSCLATIPFLITGVVPYMSTVFSLIGKGAATGIFNGLYLYTTELFPTEVRNIGLGTANTCGRVSGIAAPYVGGSLGRLWHPLPSLIFGVTGTIAGFLSLLLAETRGRMLPETVEEVEARSRGSIGPYDSNTRLVDAAAEFGTDDDVRQRYGSINEGWTPNQDDPPY